MKTIIDNAKEYACREHGHTRHTYNGMPYEYHLQMVVNVGYQFCDLIPEQDRADVIAACWTHDLIEDCRQTYNDVKINTCERVAEITYAVTNEKGKNRAQRQSDKFYSEMKQVPYAVFVKLCDRIANFGYSITNQSPMVKAYRRENDKFIEKIYLPEYERMIEFLRTLESKNVVTP